MSEYKILGQTIDSLQYIVPAGKNTVFSKLSIHNTSYPAKVSVQAGRGEVGLDTSFDPQVATAQVNAIAVQSEGKILIGGFFVSNVGGVNRTSIARVNSDGTPDTSFADPSLTGTVAFVNAVAVQSDSKILIGGFFESAGGVTRSNIARLNSDGTLDTSFDPNANNTVSAIALQPDGKILIGGQFSSVGGVTRNSIARLNSDGTLDTGFDPNVSDIVNALALQPDGKILVGGFFSTIAGMARNSIARLNSDGTLDTGFANSDLDGTIVGVGIQPDGTILIGGSFTTIGGVARSRIARLNSDGTLDAGFDLNADSIVRVFALQTDGNALFGGSFTTIGGVSRACMARLGKNLSADTATYLIKDRDLFYDDSIEIVGGLALEEDHILSVSQTGGENIIIQLYGVES